MPSRAAATRMARTAGSRRPSKAKRMAVRPRQSAIRVITFGAMTRNGTGLNRRRRGSIGSGANGGNRSLIEARSRCVSIGSIDTHERDRFQEAEHDVLPKTGGHFSASCYKDLVQMPQGKAPLTFPEVARRRLAAE